MSPEVTKYLPSNSIVQQNTECEIISKVSVMFDSELMKSKLNIGTKQKIEIDGYSESKKILCEAYAHIGELRPAQKHKVMADITKMLLVEKIFGGKWIKIIAFGDKEASKVFQGDTLHGKVAKEFSIQIKVVDLEPETKEAVLKAQQLQKMINAE